MNGMPLFNTIAIETSSLCNRSCVFCPNYKKKKEKNQFMPLDLVKKIINQLVELKYSGRIELFLYNESLLDKRIPDIARLIKESLKSVNISIMSNGDPIKSKEDIYTFFDAGVQVMQLNLYDEKSANRLIPIINEIKSSGRYDFVEGSIYTKIGQSKHNLYFVNKSVEDNFVGKEKIQNRSGNISWLLPPSKEPLMKECSRPFRIMTINWKGDAILCCNDSEGIVKFGNIREVPIIDIWHRNKALNFYRNKLLNKDRSGLKLCEVCDHNGGYYLHLLKKTWNRIYVPNKTTSKNLMDFF